MAGCGPAGERGLYFLVVVVVPGRRAAIPGYFSDKAGNAQKGVTFSSGNSDYQRAGGYAAQYPAGDLALRRSAGGAGFVYWAATILGCIGLYIPVAADPGFCRTAFLFWLSYAPAGASERAMDGRPGRRLLAGGAARRAAVDY